MRITLKQTRRKIAREEEKTARRIQHTRLEKYPPQIVLYNSSHGSVISSELLNERGLYWYSPIPIQGCGLYKDDAKTHEMDITILNDIYKQYSVAAAPPHQTIMHHYCNYQKQTDQNDLFMIKNIIMALEYILEYLQDTATATATAAATERDREIIEFVKSRRILGMDFLRVETLKQSSNNILEFHNNANRIMEFAREIYDFIKTEETMETINFVVSYETIEPRMAEFNAYVEGRATTKCNFMRLLKDKFYDYNDTMTSGLHIIYNSHTRNHELETLVEPSTISGIQKINIPQARRKLRAIYGDEKYDGIYEDDDDNLNTIYLSDLCALLKNIGYEYFAIYDNSCNLSDEYGTSFVRDITPASMGGGGRRTRRRRARGV